MGATTTSTEPFIRVSQSLYDSMHEEIARLTAERDGLEALAHQLQREQDSAIAERDEWEDEAELKSAALSGVSSANDRLWNQLCDAKRERDEWKGKFEEAIGVAVWAPANCTITVAAVEWIDNACNRQSIIHNGTDPDIYRALLEASKGERR